MIAEASGLLWLYVALAPTHCCGFVHQSGGEVKKHLNIVLLIMVLVVLVFKHLVNDN